MGLLKELYRRCEVQLHKPSHWRLRADTIDRRLFREVVIRNEYQLPARFGPRDVVLDVGAHVGSFALAALRRGAGVVYCCEASSDNFRLLQHNLGPYGDRVYLSCHAVWRSDQPVRHLHFHNATPRNTGAGGVSAELCGQLVPALAFDDLIAKAVGQGGRVRMVKLDCEGSEWPILLTSRMLHRVDSLCGEYHPCDYSGPFVVAGYTEFTPAVLKRFLAAQGFHVRTRPMEKDPRSGYFFAERLARPTAQARELALAGRGETLARLS